MDPFLVADSVSHPSRLIKNLYEFVDKVSTSPMVVVGYPGSGKTSLISYLANKITNERANLKDQYIISHFVGASPGKNLHKVMLIIPQARLLSVLHYIESTLKSNCCSDGKMLKLQMTSR